MNDQNYLIIFRTYMERYWPTPSATDALRFVYQELGEADSVAMRLGYQDAEYVRNNDVDDLVEQHVLELGQAYMMLLTYATRCNINISDALRSAMRHQFLKLVDKIPSGHQQYLADYLSDTD